MFGRGRREAERSRGLRWFAGGAALVVAGGAAALVMQPAHAAPAAPIDATFGLTGVTTSNCTTLSAGGSDIYVTPGGDLDLQTSIASLNLLGLPVSTKHIAGLDGSIVIDGNTKKPLAVGTAKATELTGLSTGDHTYKFTAKQVDLLGVLQVPLNLKLLGLAFTWSGTVHVTDDADSCGVGVALPGVEGNVGTKTIQVLPETKVTLIPSLPTLPTLPGLGGLGGLGGHKTTTPPDSGKTTGTSTKTGSGFEPGGLTVPEQVVPKGDGDGPGTVDLSGFGNALPDLGSGAGPGFVAPNIDAGTQPATAPDATSTPVAQLKPNTVELASSPSPSAQMPVLLAIIAIIALSLVTATYARLFLLRRS